MQLSTSTVDISSSKDDEDLEPRDKLANEPCMQKNLMFQQVKTQQSLIDSLKKQLESIKPVSILVIASYVAATVRYMHARYFKLHSLAPAYYAQIFTYCAVEHCSSHPLGHYNEITYFSLTARMEFLST